MNIMMVERSSDDDYSSLSSCSSLGENLDEFLNIIYKNLHNLHEEVHGYLFQAIRECYNSKSSSKSSESLEAQKLTKMWLLLNWVT